jgi:ribose transport system substrate-binding protein
MRLHIIPALMLLIALGCADRGQPSPKSHDRLVIAVVPKATTFDYWKSVHAGAAKAGKELGVEILWKGPLSESDREGQINVVQDFVTRRVSGICLAPLDSQALVGVVHEAKAEGIPTVLYDSGLESSADVVSSVATDNRAGGALAAQRLGEILGGKGRVIVLRYAPGSQSTEHRESGFLETMHTGFPAIEIVSDTEYAGATAESALDKSQQLLEKFGGQVDGIFTPCEHVTEGMLRALQERELAGKVKLVGFDASPRLERALLDKTLNGLVLQDPVRMGDLAVRTLVAHLKGQTVEPRISTGETLATPENLDTPHVKTLLHPEQLAE